MSATTAVKQSGFELELYVGGYPLVHYPQDSYQPTSLVSKCTGFSLSFFCCFLNSCCCCPGSKYLKGRVSYNFPQKEATPRVTFTSPDSNHTRETVQDSTSLRHRQTTTQLLSSSDESDSSKEICLRDFMKQIGFCVS